MKNATALVMAHDTNQQTQIVKQLTATGLFSKITPIATIADLFRRLKSAPADMICWTVNRLHPENSWINRLQAQKKWHDLPLIAFADDQQSVLTGFELGASDAVQLQIDQQELSARIKRHLQRWERLRELHDAQEELQRMALTDPLTRIGNRATFDLSMTQAMARSRRTQSPYSLLLIDLDHFKQVNDIHGHQAGDHILQQVAAAIKKSSRDADICCRYGGEEFAVILPDTAAREAEILARRIHRTIAGMSRQLPQEHQPVTVSIGIGSSSDMNRGKVELMIEQADQALYRAKRNGRNRTEIWHGTESLPADVTGDFCSRFNSGNLVGNVTGNLAMAGRI
ncbi:GGDEF domain-containing protein [Pelovirga terrestris]|uniref:diguanylate cyclase n=1 Tax=Pelovirga terrestris TaxID=2771352 RepID=A0A8J6UQ02_9BACT|nr:diguanylate cyclase [Pelovirga terrestris]MBD1401279.1 diguanylate cyclase [Pelovirga terrestris]